MNTTAKFKFDRVTLTAPLRVSVVSDDSHGAFGSAGVGAAQGLPEGIIDAAGWLKLPDGQPYPLACARPGIDPVPPLHRLTVYDGVAPVTQVQFRPVLAAPDAAELDINAAVVAGRAQVATPEQIQALGTAMEDAKSAVAEARAAAQQVTLDLSIERQRVDEALAATITAQSTLLAGSVAEVADLPTDAAAGDSYLVQRGMSVYAKGAAGWAAQYRWQAGPVPATSGGRTADALADSVRGAEVALAERSTINRVRIYVNQRHTDAEARFGKNLLQISVYNERGVRVIEGPLREWPDRGWYEIAVPPTTLQAGVYYVGVASNNTETAQLGQANSGGVEVAQEWPAPTALSLAQPVAGVPAAALLPANPPALADTGEYRRLSMIVYGQGIPSGMPYGKRYAQLVRSADGGATTTDIAPWPELESGSSPIDLVVVETLGTAWVLTNTARIYELSELSANGTWSEITPADKHPNAAGRPYGLCYMSWGVGKPPYLYFSEYSNAPHEIAAGADADRWPAVHEYDINAGTWRMSAQFEGVRHMHSLYPHLNNALYVSAGDTKLADGSTAGGVGIYRLTGSGRKTGAERDSWARVTGTSAEGYSKGYPVDFIRLSQGGAGFDAGLYCTADNPGPHLYQVKLSGTLGKFNLNTHAYNINGSATETCRSITLDPATGNLYYFAVETAEPSFYVLPPPYNQPIRLHRFDAPQSAMRGVIHGGYFMSHIFGWRLVKIE